MIHGVVAYSGKRENGNIILERSYAGIIDSLIVNNLDGMIDWLTKPYPNSLHIVWQLSDFTSLILSMVHKDKLEELKSKSRVVINESWGMVKFFSVERMFGVTTRRKIKGNFYQESETNFYQLEHWMPSSTPEPVTVTELEQYGRDVEDALDTMQIEHDKLTSPVGVYAEELRQYNLPTTYSNNEIIDASLYCEIMMRREWRCAYKVGYFDKAYSYDLQSAYPKVIANLPDTNKCRVKFSKQWMKADWGIIKARVDITSDKTPIVYDTEDGEHGLPLGKRIDMFTAEELYWIHNHQAGKIEFIDGFFFKWLSEDKPYHDAVAKLLSMRNDNEGLAASISKNMAQGLSGKLDQDNADNSLGEFYNPISAALCRSRCRLAVGDFVWDNELQNNVITIQVDGVMADRLVEVSDGWRFEGESPALVLGKGEIWKPNKKPLGLMMSEVMEAMQKYPKRSHYEFGKAAVDLVGMSGSGDRIYTHFPQNGQEALNKVSDSRPVSLAR